jgi:lysophospholipase L1-like esterase
MKRITATSVLLVAILLLISCSSSSSKSGGGSGSSSLVVMAGDSITAWGDWEDYFGSSVRVFNCGLSGRTTDGLYQDIDNCVNQKPGKIFIMIGTNDILGGNSSGVADRVSPTIDKIKRLSPQTKIYIQSILPIQGLCSVVEGVNPQLQAMSNQQAITFINLYPLFKGDSNCIRAEYYTDGIHLSDKGYQTWTNAISPYLY